MHICKNPKYWEREKDREKKCQKINLKSVIHAGTFYHGSCDSLSWGVFVLWSLRLLILSLQGAHNVNFHPNVVRKNAFLIWNKKAILGSATKGKYNWSFLMLVRPPELEHILCILVAGNLIKTVIKLCFLLIKILVGQQLPQGFPK